ncbi:kinase domain protein (macronuclear) [Tetrahymena thermophila SB210]|uniref:Kinase domain protein n=1 Tax=Tetrahymena thermophila (strain SB210) TaxID=312017 RepID=Q226M0_TETTS|nr:kinase domain protein [Tetrahymena thermophila SB210]EAR81235.3 kinase domain protein [Tetrahymena thermophila SB210]|eukprot:XP_001028898.3 kinase domain protein [Tetrahymena thermophila SB210]
MAFEQYNDPFQNINIKRNTEIFEFIKLLVVWERVNRASLSTIVEQNTNQFKSNQNKMKSILSKHYLGPIQNVETVNIGSVAPLISQNQIPIQDIKQIKIDSMKELYKITEFQVVEIYLKNQEIFNFNH